MIMNNLFPDRPMPSDTEAERAILGGILVNNALITDCIDHITQHDFYVPFHRKVYEAMLALFQEGKAIDPILIGNEMKRDGDVESIGGVSAIANLTTGLPYFTDLLNWIAIVKEKSRGRKLIQICSVSSDGALGEDANFYEVLDQHEQLISELRNKDVVNHFVPIRTSLKANYEQISAFAKSGGEALLGLTTGYKEIDSATGGLEKKDLIILAARPSMGKTSLALNIAQRAATSDPNVVIAVFSLEMSKEQLTQRMVSGHAGVDLRRLRLGHLTNPEWTRVADATTRLSNLNILIDDTPAITTMQMKAKLRRLMTEKKRIDLVIVDHLDLFRHPDHRLSRHLQLSQIVKELKTITKEFDIPGLILHQLSRTVEKRNPPRPMMSDLRESGTIEEVADIVAFIYRPEYYLKEKTPEQDRGVAEILIEKSRNGPTGTYKLAFLKEFTRFEDLYRG